MKYVDGQTFLNMLVAASYALDKEKATLNKLNVFPIPDGDTGNNMSLTLSSLRNLKISSNNLGEVSQIIAKEMLLNSRGNSGTILAAFFLGVAKAHKGKDKISVDEMIEAFKVGQKSSYKMIMTPQEGTILTLMREASNVNTKNINSFEELFNTLTSVSQDNLMKTPDLLPILKQAGVVDSGSYGFVVIIKAMRDYLLNNEYETMEKEVSSCEFELNLILNKDPNYVGENKLDFVKEELTKLGTLNEFIEQNKILKIRIIASDNEKVITLLEQYGKVSDYEVSSVSKKEDTNQKEFSIVGVANGDGLILTLKDLGFDEIIDGKTTLNVAYKDLKEACDRANSKVVFLFPNNKDTIPTALLLSKTIEDYKIIVIETTSIMQSIYLANIIDKEKSVEENELNIRKSLSKIISIAITSAAKDTTIGKLEIKKNQKLLLVDSKIHASFDSLEETFDYISKLLLKYNVISIYYGKDVKEEDANKYRDQLDEALDYDLDVLSFYGGQNIYDYLILGE